MRDAHSPTTGEAASRNHIMQGFYLQLSSNPTLYIIDEIEIICKKRYIFNYLHKSFLVAKDFD